MFIDTLSALCAENHISTYKLCEKIGLNRSAVAKWKKGSLPNSTSLNKIATYFGISVDVLLGRDPDIILNTTKYGNAIVTGKEQPHIHLTGVAMSNDKKWSQFKIEQPGNEQKNKLSAEAESFSENKKELMDLFDSMDEAQQESFLAIARATAHELSSRDTSK